MALSGGDDSARAERIWDFRDFQRKEIEKKGK